MPFRKNKLSHEENLSQWLTTIPVKNCDYFEGSDGNYVLQVTKSDNRFLLKIISHLSKSSHFKFKLDNRGSFIWEHCDGSTSIEQICQLLEKEFGDSVKPTADRTIRLFRNLYQYRLVKFFRENSSRTVRSDLNSI